MENQKKILVTEVPMEQLKELGIDEKAFLDLPKDALDKILTGNLSPLMKMQITNVEGKQVEFPAKFRLTRDEQGNVNVAVQPVRKQLENKLGLTPDEIERLKNQETILKPVATREGNEMKYVQYDKDLNIVFTQKQDAISIPNAIGDVILGTEDVERIRKGQPVELEVGDTKVTVGVDLNSRGGFRVVNGDIDMWRQKKLEQWDRITPGAQGYWKTTENGWEYQKHIEQNLGRGQKQNQEQERSMGYRMRR